MNVEEEEERKDRRRQRESVTEDSLPDFPPLVLANAPAAAAAVTTPTTTAPHVAVKPDSAPAAAGQLSDENSTVAVVQALQRVSNSVTRIFDSSSRRKE